MKKKYNSLFWDFDGVLINSNTVRTEGFRYIFKEYKKELVDKLISYHTQNGGKSRYDKISFFYSHILKVCLFLGMGRSSNNSLLQDFSEFAQSNNIEITVKLHPRDRHRYSSVF